MTQESNPFVDWVRDAVDHGVKCLDVSNGEVLVMLETESGKRHTTIIEYLGDGPLVEGRLSVARDFIIAEVDDASYYALIWSAQGPDITGKRYVDVIAVESGARSGESVYLTQPYKLAKDGSPVRSGGPLISTVEIPNMWTAGEIDSDSVEYSNEVTEDDLESESDEELEPGPVEDLVERVFGMAVERRTAGNETPCACLANIGDEEFNILDPSSEDASADEIIDFLRQHVATLEDWEMYAIVYCSKMEVDGKEMDAIIVEAGDRHGDAPVYGLPFKISKSGKMKIEAIEFLEGSENLWVETEE